jgi:hypothetical protein
MPAIGDTAVTVSRMAALPAFLARRPAAPGALPGMPSAPGTALADPALGLRAGRLLE